MIKKMIDFIEEQHLEISQWVSGFIGILFVRFLFESLSSPTPSGVIPSDPYALIHIGLFFLASALVIVLIIGSFTKKYLLAFKFTIFTLPIIWIAPILDIIISRGDGYIMSYIYNSHYGILVDFFKLFSFNPMIGATYGMRIEIVIIIIGVGVYTFIKTKKVHLSLISTILSYVAIFLLGTIPSIIYTVGNINGAQITNPADIIYYISKVINNSNILHNTLHETPSFVGPIRFFQISFDKMMTQILFLISFILGTLIFYKVDSKKFLAIVKNSRVERVLFYQILLFVGMAMAYIMKFGIISSWIDILSIICISISWISLWMYAIHTNDIFDKDIDKISNPERPIVTQISTEKEMQQVGYLWLSVGLLGAWAVGYYPFFMSLVYIATSYIYSSPPLRMKGLPILSSFLISIACLATILAGFFFLSQDKRISSFPIFQAIGIIIIFTLATNIRDLKDVEGDRLGGIKTLPVIFGRLGNKVVGGLFMIAILLVPPIFKANILYIMAIPASLIGYCLINKKPYREKPLFFLIIFFMIFTASFIFLKNL